MPRRVNWAERKHYLWVTLAASYILFIFMFLNINPTDVSDASALNTTNSIILFINIIILILVTRSSNEPSKPLLLALTIALSTTIIPIIKYQKYLDPNLDNYYHTWFSSKIAETHHIPASTTYSDMPFSHLAITELAFIQGTSIPTSLFLLNATIILGLFTAYIIIIKTTNKKSLITISSMLLLAIPYETYIPFYFRPRIYALLMVLFLFYYMFLKRNLKPIELGKEETLIALILFASSLFTNISYSGLILFLIIIYYIFLKITPGKRLPKTTKTDMLANLLVFLFAVKLTYDYVFNKIIYKIKYIMTQSKVTTVPTSLEIISVKYKIIGLLIVYGKLLVPSLILFLMVFILLLSARNKKYLNINIKYFYYSLLIVNITYAPVILVLTKNLANALRALYFTLIIVTPSIILFINIYDKKFISSLIKISILLILLIYFPTTYQVGSVDPTITIEGASVPLVEWSYSDSALRVGSVIYLGKYFNYDSNYLIVADRNSLLMLLKYSPELFLSKRIYHNLTLLLESESVSPRYLLFLHLDREAGIYHETLVDRLPPVYQSRVWELSGRISLLYNNNYVYVYVNASKPNIYS